MEKCDVLVVGAGPSGLIAAQEASKRGVKCIVLEEDASVGEPVHCAGLVSSRGLELLGFRGDYVQNAVRGAVLYSPSGLELKMDAEREVAYVIDRAEFDKLLADEAVKAGAELRCGARAVGLLWSNGKVSGARVHSEGGFYNIVSKVTIDAEGARFKLLRDAGLRPPNLNLLYPAAQVEVEGADVYEDFVEIFLGERWAPGFFCWIIPYRGGARVGCASKIGRPNEFLKKFINEHPLASLKLKGAKVVKRSGGLLVLGGGSGCTYRGGLMVVGDAAGQVKPTTGGGIVFGGLSARIAGEGAANLSRGEDEGASRRYDVRWRKLIGRELRWMLRLRRLASSLSDRELDRLFLYAQKLKLEEELAYRGDMDFHASSMLKLLKVPKLTPLFAILIKSLVMETFKNTHNLPPSLK